MKRILLGLAVLGLSLATTFAYGEGNDEHTVLLLHFNGEDGSANFVDDSLAGYHTVTANGNAQVDTVQYVFGGASGLFDGSGDYLSIPDSDDWNFGSGDFTVDCWVRLVSLPGIFYGTAFIGNYDSAVDKRGWYFSLRKPTSDNYYLTFSYSTDGNNQTNIEADVTEVISLNTWYHCCVTRSGNTLRLFLDGNLVGTGDMTGVTIFNTSADLYIGTMLSVGVPAYFMDGWFDEVRISKGIARWTSDFTPPTEEYSIFEPYPPVADAGDDIVAYANELVILDGSASYDPDGTIIDYTWRRLPDNIVLCSGPNATCEIRAAGWVEEIVELTVRNELGTTATDSMSILSKTIDDIELTPGPQGPTGPPGEQGLQGEQGPQGPAGITPEEVSAMQNQITALQQQNALQQQRLDEDRYLLEQLPQLRHALEELQSQLP